MSITKLHTPLTKIALALFTAASSLVLSSCQDEDYGFTTEEVRASVYDRNFIAKYGEIDPEQSWDLSKYANNGNLSQTRAAIPECPCPVGGKREPNTEAGWGANGKVETVNEWYFVEDQLVKSFNEKLREGDSDNKNKGTTGFNLHSNGVFYIIPMYQGQSGLGSDLHMVVTYGGKTYDNMVWSRSKDIQRQTEGSLEWLNLYNNEEHFTNVDYYKDTQAGKYLASTRDAKGIKTKPIKCDIPYGAEIKFYLHINTGHVTYRRDGSDMDGITTGANGYEPNLALSGDKMWSDRGKMIQLSSDGFQVNNADRYGKEFMIIACEDAWGRGEREAVNYTTDRDISNKDITIGTNDWSGDDDMNDLVFLFVSDKLPSVVEANQVRKRYIIEDLGSVVDWDFNDIVVDLAETTDPITNEKSQKAVLKHLCGTTPFRLFIGEAGNVANSTELKFSCSNLSVKMDDGSYDRLTISNATGSWIPGLQMSQYEELNLECALPSSNPWKPADNNIWVLVDKNRQYGPNRNNNGANADSQTGADPYGGELEHPNSNGVINGVISELDENFATVAFPRKGKVPRIIAVDTDFQWTKEDTDISKDLWSYYTITVSTQSVGSNGAGSVSGAGNYKGGRTVTLTATPEPGNIFVGWTNGVKDRTLTFSATSNASYTAQFKNVTDPHGWEYNNGELNTLWNSVTIEGLSQLLSDGYNTIKVKATRSGGSFGLKSRNSTNDYIVPGDAGAYFLDNSGEATVVLTKEQIQKIIDDSHSLTVQARSDNFGNTTISFLNTQDVFTVELMEVEHGGIKAADRESGFWTSDNDPTGANSPWSLNGHRAFIKAAYAAPTDNNPGAPAVLTAEPETGYYFSRWEQYDGSAILNTDTNNPITIKSDAKLKAVFAPYRTLVVNVTGDSEATLDVTYTDEGGNDVLPNQVKAGQKVTITVSATKDGLNSDGYSFAWSGVDGLGSHSKSKTITMPDNNVTLNLTMLYHIKANIALKVGDNAYEKDCGKVNIKLDGDETEYVNEAWGPVGTAITMTAVPNYGFSFKDWGWSSENPRTDLRCDGYKQPTAYFEETSETWAIDLRENNAEVAQNGTYTIDRDNNNYWNFLSLLSPTKRTIKVNLAKPYPTSGIANLFILDWDHKAADGKNKAVNSGSFSVTLTEEEVNTFKNAQTPRMFIQYYDSEGSEQKIKIELILIKQ